MSPIRLLSCSVHLSCLLVTHFSCQPPPHPLTHPALLRVLSQFPSVDSKRLDVTLFNELGKEEGSDSEEQLLFRPQRSNQR